VTLVFFAVVPQPPERAMFAGLLAFGGDCCRLWLAVIFWPLRRLRGARVLGELYLELAPRGLPVQVMQAPRDTQTHRRNRAGRLDRDHSDP